MRHFFKIFLISLVFFGVNSFSSFAQDSTNNFRKTGWNVGALPAISFSTDLGFQYGALANFFYYGDGTQYPDYLHSFYLEASRYTLGSSALRFYYDSDALFKGKKFALDISYLVDQAYDFYGFNGLEAVYQSTWTDDAYENNGYKTRMFYKYQRKLLRIKADLQLPLKSVEHLFLHTGLGFFGYDINRVNITKINDGLDADEQLPSHDEQPGLFEQYLGWNLISADEADGGNLFLLKAGLVFDNRNNHSFPGKGLWTSFLFEYAPGIAGDFSFGKIALVHRQYFTLPLAFKPVFAYRAGYQTTFSGHTPFFHQVYMMTTFFKSSLFEGLGGENSMRGMLRNRVLADGFLYGNFEFRIKLLTVELFNQQFYLAINPFTDLGYVTQKIDVIYPGENPDYFSDKGPGLHTTYGAGFKVAMNENFVLSADMGFSALKQDGDKGFYIGMNYLF
jgi:outer membrane protein assembly factor BamA